MSKINKGDIMSIINAILKKAVPLPDLLSYDNFLFVAPHPDDIEIGAGAMVALLTKLDKKVTFLVATDGRYGTADESISPERLVEIRREEQIKSAKILGVEKVEFLSFKDGGDYDLYAMTCEIAKAICRIRPQVVFAPDFTLTTELHADHLNVGKATANAFIMAEALHIAKEWGLECINCDAIAFYYTNKPNKIFKTKKGLKLAIKAIRQHKSQFPPDEKGENQSLKGIETYLKLRALRLGLKRFSLSACGFRVLGKTHAHCCPESESF